MALLPYLLAYSIVHSYSKILDQRDKHAKKSELLTSLKTWQRIARNLVHELRGPITPIKLVTSSLEEKNTHLNPDEFKKQLSQGVNLITKQIQTVERMIENFTQFSKLPAPHLKPIWIQEFLTTFQSKYDGYENGRAHIKIDSLDHRKISVLADTVQLEQVFFNLLRNASEANPGAPILRIDLELSLQSDLIGIKFKNHGTKISKEVSEKIFDLDFSTKSNENSNMEIGLTVSKKILLDHGGDLSLIHDPNFPGTTFYLELPKGVPSEK